MLLSTMCLKLQSLWCELMRATWRQLATAVAMLADATQEHVVVLHHVAHGKLFPERSWFLRL